MCSLCRPQPLSRSGSRSRTPQCPYSLYGLASSWRVRDTFVYVAHFLREIKRPGVPLEHIAREQILYTVRDIQIHSSTLLC